MKTLLRLCAPVCMLLLFAQLAFAQAAAPVCTPAAGTYASTQSVSCSTTTASADLFYTLDNTTPTPESIKYTGPITVNANTTLKIIAAVASVRQTNIQNNNPNVSGTYWKAVDCVNGGGSGVPTGLVHSSGIASPSLSGASMEFSMTAHGAQTNCLWSVNTSFGKGDTSKWQQYDYELYLDPGVCTNNGTTEQDDAKVAPSLGNLRYMAGAQWRRNGCTSGHACLDIAGNSNVSWTFTGVDIPLACGIWHHMQRSEMFVPAEVTSKPCVDRNGAHWPYVYQRYWIVDGTKYDNGGAGWKYCANSVNWPSWEWPQHQEDATNGTHTMYLDQANFTAWFPESAVTTNAYTITGGTGTPTATTPSISPAGGLGLTTTQTVTLADTTPGAAIHYTTDGSTPTCSSTTYSTPLSIAVTTTVKAIACASGYNNSALASAVYSFSSSGGLTATPVLSPAAGSYTATQHVSLTDTTSGAVIYFTSDGTTPTTSSSVYSVPLVVSATATIKAMAAAPGLTNSSVASATYTITATLIAATPTFSPVAGNYSGTQTVALADTTTGAVIHYTTDGSTPTGASTTYSTPLTVSSTTTVKAIAIASGYSNSAVGVALYTIGCGLTPYATGNIDPTQLKANGRQGVGLLVQMAGGSFTTNDLLYYDCNGTAIDSGTQLSALATKSAVQQESYVYAADTGTANAYAITLSPVPTIVAGSIATLKVGHTNTGASTLAVNGGTATAVKKGDGTVALAASDWTIGQIVTVKYDGTNWQWGGGSSGGGTGTVTSVGLSLPAIFSVSGTPITTTGTLTATLATQTANTFFAGPSSGGAAAPTFRAIVPADLPLGSAVAFGAVKCDGTTITCAGGVISSVSGGSGTVTSVALSMPSDYSVSGSPITGAGTFTVTGGTTKSAIQQQSYVYAADTGSANAYAVTLSPAPTIVAGSHVVFKAANANTTASTLAVNGGTATAIKKQGSTALVSGDIPAGGIEEVVFDGTNYQLIASASTGGGGPTLQTNGTNNGSQSTLNLAAGTNMTATDNGSGTVTLACPTCGGSGALILLESHTASSSAELDFTTSITSTYDQYVIEVLNLVPATNGADLYLQFSTNGGSTYDATAGHYAWAAWRWDSTATGVSGSTSTTAICFTSSSSVTSSTAANGGIVGTYKIFNPLSGTMHTLLTGQNNSWFSGDPDLPVTMGGSYLQTTAVNAFRIFFGSGNITSGKVRVYGIAH